MVNMVKANTTGLYNDNGTIHQTIGVLRNVRDIFGQDDQVSIDGMIDALVEDNELPALAYYFRATTR